MKVAFDKVFSAQELQVLILKEQEKLNVAEIAEKMNKSKRHIHTVIRRIKNKIQKLEEDGIIIDYEENVIKLNVSEEIKDIFIQEENKSLRKKLTVTQAAFLQNQSMHTTSKSPSTNAERVMKYRLGIKQSRKDEVRRRKMTDEEWKEFIERWEKGQQSLKQMPDKNIYKILNEYENKYGQATNIEEMAAMEVILRANGLIYRTPYINKQKAKTGACMRAASEGKKVVLVENQSDRSLLPPDAKLISSEKDEEGNVSSVWILEKW